MAQNPLSPPHAPESTAAAPSKRIARKTRRPFPRRARRGVIQILLMAAVAMIVIVIIFQMFNAGISVTRSMSLNTQIAQITSTVDRVYQNRGDFPTSDITDNIITRGKFTGSSVQGTAPNRTLVSPYSTNMTVTGAGGRDYVIAIAEIPVEACAGLLETYIGDSTNIDGIAVEGTALALPIDGPAIDTACSGQADELYNVALTF